MSSRRPPFHRNVSPAADSSWYREKQEEEEWSPRSQESDHDPSFDSDEENHQSNVITITDSSSSSFESPLPWSKNSSFSHSSPSASLALSSQGGKVCQDSVMSTESTKEYIAQSNSLVIGKRSRSIGLKDIDLTRSLAAKHIREAKEANKSPKKSHLFSPLSRQMSCPPSFNIGPSDRHGVTGKTGQTGLSRGLNLKLSHSSDHQVSVGRR
ncbi:hypothetical protein OS493_007462 [Desmophyllum pertusum]|uniref:Uncharacterized protein n=1 Tax=Desmophyllum pertusum TaxID=174260 RepID=A0A9W9Z3P4_9CNID|nr:hypothetical protein OS493_007462 [Desmophyllum pertusum]